MTLTHASELVSWLKTSYLVSGSDWTIEAAAECYDEMNDNTELQDALKTLGLWEETA